MAMDTPILERTKLARPATRETVTPNEKGMFWVPAGLSAEFEFPPTTKAGQQASDTTITGLPIIGKK